MKRFSEMAIKAQSETNYFDCKQISINEILNCEIIIKDYLPGINTKHGENRFLVLIENANVLHKFFTNSNSIKNTLEAIQKCDFPFISTIKSTKTTNGVIYKLT